MGQRFIERGRALGHVQALPGAPKAKGGQVSKAKDKAIRIAIRALKRVVDDETSNWGEQTVRGMAAQKALDRIARALRKKRGTK